MMICHYNNGGKDMERKEYLNRCQKCAILPRGLFGVVESCPAELQVIYGNVPYYPQSYELRFTRDGKPQHIAILHDLTANSVTCAELERVKEYEIKKKNN